jgi:hypothetical protein
VESSEKIQIQDGSERQAANLAEAAVVEQIQASSESQLASARIPKYPSASHSNDPAKNSSQKETVEDGLHDFTVLVAPQSPKSIAKEQKEQQELRDQANLQSNQK